jgi:MGT family glycosyltransferase
MARFLFVPVPVAGHVAPALGLARGVARRGHEVTVVTGSRFRPAVEGAGVRFQPFPTAPDIEFERLNELFPERPQQAGIAQVKWDMKRLVIDLAAQQYQDLCAIAERAPPDAVLADVMALSGYFVAERRCLPLALLNPLNLFLPSSDTFPDGFGVAPSRTTLGRLRNRLANWLVFDVVLRDVNTYLHELRARLGLAEIRTSMFAAPARRSQLILQPTVPEFEYPRSDLPPHLHFIGALPPPGPAEWQEPAWWPRLHDDRPVVLISQGTVATNFDDLVRPALSALGREDVLVVATTGNRPVEDVGEPPANTVVAPFVPFDAIMPHVDVMVTNGGYGGIHFALCGGVPLVAAGQTEDKMETCARVGWSGVGINLRSNRPRPAELRDAVMAVLRDSTYRERVRTIKDRLDAYDGPARGAELLERLAATREPVLRTESSW